MNKIQDYNLKLLNALHSWFWYNGLLDSVDENCLILKLISILRETEDEILTFHYLKEKYNIDISSTNEELNVLWILLVEMFGNCGTSPRTGWIEKRKACADFLEAIVEIEELHYKLREAQVMSRKNKEKIYFILKYHEDFDDRYLLEDCLDLLTEEQLKELFDGYQEEYEEAWEYYKENEEYYKYCEEAK